MGAVVAFHRFCIPLPLSLVRHPRGGKEKVERSQPLQSSLPEVSGTAAVTNTWLFDESVPYNLLSLVYVNVYIIIEVN